MAEKVLMKGNEAIAEAAVIAGCRHYFGYPITPQTEITEYMARRMPKVNGTFVQAESEVAAINMVYGAAGAGARVMTSSSSPGISLKQEGISYIAAAQLPAVIVNIMRGGPGLGTIQASQADYFQATKGGGHGDYRLIVLAPNSVQEMIDLTIEAFDLADKYRTPVMILGDGAIGQMMEPAILPKAIEHNIDKSKWATTTRAKRTSGGPNVVNSLFLQAEELEKYNVELQGKFATITSNEVRFDSYLTEDADIVVVGYGIMSRIAHGAIDKLRAEGLRVGLLRPITLWPFPYMAIQNLIPTAKKFLVAEMSAGQMIEDVMLAVVNRRPVYLCGKMGGVIPTVDQMIKEIIRVSKAV
ncbi:MAG: 3-methyl-2-oxobutanoate dehydrogenase subunit VorB [Bacillota bacterium]